MSAPQTELPSSISSSGHLDGLGRRVLAFDRQTGAMLEHLHVRPELAAFEAAIRARVEQLAAFHDERFARPSAVERDPDTGDLAVVSAFVPGSRLAELLEVAHDQAAVPGVDVALGFLLAALPALSALHTTAGFAHGLIDPGRTVLTPSGQVVLLDCAFGAVVERLRLSRRRLWSDFRLAAPPGSDLVALDAIADVAQTTLNAVMLVLGRAIREDEYPDRIPSLVMEVVDVAQIRGTSGFASGLQRILQRSLPLPGRRPYRSADEMIVEVRQLVRREIGVDLCRQALVDFVLQMDATSGAALAPPVEDEDYRYDESGDELAASDEGDSSNVLEFEVPLDAALERTSAEDDDAVYDLSSFAAPSRRVTPVERTPPAGRLEPQRREPDPEPAPPPPAPRTRSDEIFEIAIPEPSITIDIAPLEPPAPEPRWEAAPAYEAFAPAPADVPPIADRSPAAEWPDPLPEPAASPTAPEPAPELPEPETPHDSRSSRRKRQQQKSARARKDKLRSTAVPAKTAAAAAPPEAPAVKDAPKAPPKETPKETKSGWLIPPERAAQFEPPVDTPAPVVAPVPVVPAPPGVPPPAARPMAPPMPVYPPPPATVAPAGPAYPPPQTMVPPAVPQPAFGAPQQASGYGVPGMPRPAAPAPQAPVVKVDTPALKIKAEPPPGYAPARAHRREPVIDRSVLEPVSALPYVQRGAMFDTAESRGFPWKLAAAVVVVMAIAIVAGRAYLPGRAQAQDPEEASDKAAAATPTPGTQPDPPKPAAPPAKGMGQITVETQPAGARVLVDGKAVGDSPLTVDVRPGRHVVTLVGQSGTVMRTVRVAAGKTATLDVPIFSGWVAVFSPIALEIAENGQALGTTEQNRIMLSPGRHTLTLSNPDLDYKTQQDVEIEPGEVRTVTVSPKGTANFNAVPWAEVWIDGQKIGETPIANYALPLGLREFTFKHPQHGERKISATVRGNAPVAVSVDFTRQ